MTAPGDARLVQPVGPERAGELTALFRREWWTADRVEADVARLLAGSRLSFGLLDGAERLVGFTRVLSDGVYKALVLDVIVAAERRGRGEGRLLMEAVLGHPELRGVRHFELYCLPELVPFYERWGFSAELGTLRFMRRSDPSR